MFEFKYSSFSSLTSGNIWITWQSNNSSIFKSFEIFKLRSSTRRCLAATSTHIGAGDDTTKAVLTCVLQELQVQAKDTIWLRCFTIQMLFCLWNLHQSQVQTSVHCPAGLLISVLQRWSQTSHSGYLPSNQGLVQHLPMTWSRRIISGMCFCTSAASTWTPRSCTKRTSAKIPTFIRWDCTAFHLWSCPRSHQNSESGRIFLMTNVSNVRIP